MNMKNSICNAQLKFSVMIFSTDTRAKTSRMNAHRSSGTEPRRGIAERFNS